MSIGARVATCRAGGGSAVAFLSFEIGAVRGEEFTPVLKINDVVLRQRDDGEYWLSFPSKQRLRDGKPVLNDAGRPIYDDFVTPAFERGANGQGWRMTDASLRFKDYLITKAVEAYSAMAKENSGRGSVNTPAPAAQSRTAAAPKRQRIAEPQEANFAVVGTDDDDDLLPF